MTPETALKLQDRLAREISGLQQLVDQLDRPGTASTLAGLKSGLGILARSLLRTNRIVHDLTRAAVEPPPMRNPFDGMFGRQ